MVQFIQNDRKHVVFHYNLLIKLTKQCATRNRTSNNLVVESFFDTIWIPIKTYNIIQITRKRNNDREKRDLTVKQRKLVQNCIIKSSNGAIHKSTVTRDLLQDLVAVVGTAVQGSQQRPGTGAVDVAGGVLVVVGLDRPHGVPPAGHHGGRRQVQVAAVDDHEAAHVQRPVHVPRPHVGAAAGRPEVHVGAAVRAQHVHAHRLDAHLGHGAVRHAVPGPRVQRVHVAAVPVREVQVRAAGHADGHQVQDGPPLVAVHRRGLGQPDRVQPVRGRVVHDDPVPGHVRHVNVQPTAGRAHSDHVLEHAVRPRDRRQVGGPDHRVRGQVDGDQLRRAQSQRFPQHVDGARVQSPQHAGLHVRVHHVHDASATGAAARPTVVMTVIGIRPDVRLEVRRVQPERAQRPRHAGLREPWHGHVGPVAVHLEPVHEDLARFVPAVQYVAALLGHRRPLEVGAGQQKRTVLVGRRDPRHSDEQQHRRRHRDCHDTTKKPSDLGYALKTAKKFAIRSLYDFILYYHYYYYNELLWNQRIFFTILRRVTSSCGER